MSLLTDIKIVPAQKRDIAEIYAVEQSCFSSDKFSKRRFSYLMAKAKSDFVIIKKDNRIIAYLIILKRKNSKQYRIYSIAIMPETRGLGLAKMLIDYTHKQAKLKSIEKISLEVNVDNYAAINLYKSQGFYAVSAKEKYYSDGSNALVMHKKV